MVYSGSRGAAAKRLVKQVDSIRTSLEQVDLTFSAFPACAPPLPGLRHSVTAIERGDERIDQTVSIGLACRVVETLEYW